MKRAHSDQGDEDSLFGSPPPSPARGRSPSLALPSGNGTISAQNVGTIALPGSHPYSELSVNPLALSLSGSSSHPRPPAISQSHMVSSRAQTSLLSSRNSAARNKPTGRTKSASSSRSATPRPPPPPITLPDPDLPVPQNFLRNQQALLGLAGVVGGVNPANLSVPRHARGTSSGNPIVIDDTPDAPFIGYRNREQVDLAQLPPPSNEDIVASLINQKNIFPVLQSILKLMGNSQGCHPGFEPQRGNVDGGEAEPAIKRRKFDKVPAGATDWDVPYPFTDGEGPQEYSAKWEKERGKQLISQLVGIIKTAALKAATKKYVKKHRKEKSPTPKSAAKAKSEEKGQEQKVHGHYRPVTLTYGLDGPHAQAVLTDNSNVNIRNPSPSASCTPYDNDFGMEGAQKEESTTPFEQLISGLLSAQGGPGPDTGSSEGVTSPSFDTLAQDFDEGLFDNWMELLKTFPMEDINGVDDSGAGTADSASDPLGAPPNDQSEVQSLDSISSHSNVQPSERMIFPDFAIDPALLAISPPVAPEPPTPSLSASPMLSASSQADPLTPNWGTAFPDPGIASTDQDLIADDPLAAARMLLGFASNSDSQQGQQMPVQCAPSEPPLLDPHPDSSSSKTTHISSKSCRPGRSNDFKRDGSDSRHRSKPMLKDDTLQMAKERRRQLAAEVERAKVELWETTIEQGVLVQISKEI